MRDSAWCTPSSFIQLRAGLLQPQLGVAMVELADHLALLDEIAHVDGRREHAAGHQRSDIGSLIGGEGPGLFEGGGDGPRNGLRGGDGKLLESGGSRGRGLIACATGQHDCK
jgi:hypothetical protein